MAVKRRSKRRATRRRTTHATANPAPRRSQRAVAHRTRRNGGLFASSRRRNPASRKARRRNPRGTSLFSKGLVLAGGAALVQFTLGFIPPIGGVSPLADAARTAGAGWLLGTAMNKTGFGRQYADDVMLAGFTLAGGKLISSFILPFANRLFTPKPAPQAEGEGVKGLATMYPGLQPFGAYGRGMNGLNGIALIDPSMQPFGEYANN